MACESYFKRLKTIEIQYMRKYDESDKTYDRRIMLLDRRIKQLVKGSNAYDLLFDELVLGKKNTPIKTAVKIALDTLNSHTSSLKNKLNINIRAPESQKSLRLEDKRINDDNDNRNKQKR